MGLDMYAFATEERIEAEVDFSEPQKKEQLHYWRKHPDLHGWMEERYFDRGGENPDFNLEPLRLTGDDLDQLERAIRQEALPETHGFFFGRSDGSEQEDDLDFVRKAQRAMSEGKTVFYIAWW